MLTSRCCNMRSTSSRLAEATGRSIFLPRGLLPSLALAGRNLGLLWRNGGLLAGPSAASAPAAGHATKSSTFACVRPPFYRPDKIKKPGLPEVAGAVKTLGQRRSPRDGFRSRNS